MTPDQIAKNGTEAGHQRAFFAWLAFARVQGFPAAVEWLDGAGTNAGYVPPEEWAQPELALFHAIPNGGKRDKITAANLKAEGVKAGVPDTFLPVPKEYTVPHFPVPGDVSKFWYMGLYIEFKKPDRKNHADGGVSDAQNKFMDLVRDQGYCCRVAYSWREAANIVLSYYGVDIRLKTA